MTEAAAIAKVGVEAVVEGVKTFEKAFGSMNDWLDQFSLKGSKLSKVFEPVNRVIGGFFESIKRIAEFVAAGLILRGIEKITSAVRDMADEMVNAAIEFQGLQIRLENFLAADFLESGAVSTLADGLAMAVEPAEELFFWIQKIAIATPFDSNDIANTFTMAKAWGFNTEEAQALTQQVIDFTAGMGLGGEAMDRVIKALGQMKSLGRVAGQELLQLANAGVPVADIMESIRLELGLTVDEFEALRADGGVSAEMFFAKWEEMVNTRFIGSADRMSMTLQGVLSNVKDLINGVLGFNVVKPVLDVVSNALGGLLTALTAGENFDKLIVNAQKMGDALSGLAEAIIGKFLPEDMNSAADAVIDFFERIADGIVGVSEIIKQSATNDVDFMTMMGAIIDFLAGGPDAGTKVQQIWQTITQTVDRIKEIFQAFREEGLMGGLGELGVPDAILNFVSMIISALDNIITFWTDNEGDISQIFKDIATGLGETLGLTGELPEGENSLLEIVGALIVGLSEKLVDNAPDIIDGLERVGNSITEDFLPAFREIAQWIVDNQDLVLHFLASFLVGVTAMKVVAGILAAVGGALYSFLAILIGSSILNEYWKLDKWIDGIRNLVSRINNWYGSLSDAGRNLVAGFFNGIINYFYQKYGYILYLFEWLVNMIRGYLQMGSPSKLFEDIGENVMKGFANGIENAVQLPADAMKMAVTHIIQPATSSLQGGTTNNQTVNNNYNMNINTQASAEPIMADFRMMQSFAGGG